MTQSTIDLAHEVWAMAQGPQPIDIATVAIAARLDEFVERANLDAVRGATAPASQPAALPAGMPEPDAYMFQHEETGLVQFVDAQQVEWGFEENNPRLKRIDAVYTAAQVQAMLAQGLAPGWKAVPVEPTMKMISALGFGGDEDLAIGHASISAGIEKAYRALLEAAPAPEQAHGIKAQ